MSKDLRSAIVDIIINEGGDPSTGEFNSTYSRVAWAVKVDHVTVSKIWKQFCDKQTLSLPQKITVDVLVIFHTETYVWLKREKPSIS